MLLICVVFGLHTLHHYIYVDMMQRCTEWCPAGECIVLIIFTTLPEQLRPADHLAGVVGGIACLWELGMICNQKKLSPNSQRCRWEREILTGLLLLLRQVRPHHYLLLLEAPDPPQPRGKTLSLPTILQWEMSWQGSPQSGRPERPDREYNWLPSVRWRFNCYRVTSRHIH